MNNNAFSLARHLAREGVTSTIYCYADEKRQFSPSFDTNFGNSSNNIILRYLELPNSLSLDIDSLSKCKHIFESNLTVACGAALSWSSRLEKPVDIFLPYGSDLWELPRFKFVKPQNQLFMLSCVKHQKSGIKNASYIHAPYTNDFYEPKINKLRPHNPFRLTNVAPFCYPYDRIESFKDKTYTPKSQHFHIFSKLRQEFKKIIVFPSRINTFNPKDPNSKGSDLFLYEIYKNKNLLSDTNTAIVFFDYSADSSQFKQLVYDLKLEDFVKLMPMMPRIDLSYILHLADFCVPSLGVTWFVNSVILEAIAMKCCLINQQMTVIPENTMYPSINYNHYSQIFVELLPYLNNHKSTFDITEKAFNWYERQVNLFASTYLSFLP